MAKKTKKQRMSFWAILLAFIIGACAGFACLTYFTLPETDQLVVGEEVFYSYENSSITNEKLDLKDDELSVHFLELGNKYTGDCTYIKYGDVDILIDCGSKTNSIEAVSSYLNRYVTDKKLEYVIITHAHTDHYAGFATSQKVKSIFDLYQCEKIITFSKSNQTTSATYLNYKRELNDAISNGAEHFTALECWNESLNAKGEQAQKQFVLAPNLTLNILYQKFYIEQATTENNYSVCCLITHGSGENAHNFLFTGDLEKEGEQSLVESNPNLPHNVDVYKAGHHGSKTSSNEVLLERVHPQIVCICCCAGSPEYTKTAENQFPTQEFIDRMSKFNITEIYVTTLCLNYDDDEFTSFNGNITIISNLNSTDLTKCFSNSSKILKDSDWFKNNRVWKTST